MLVERLHEWPIVAIDVETTGLKWYKDNMWSFAVACHDPATGEWMSEYYDIRRKPNSVVALADVANRCQRVVNHALKFDLHFLRNEGVDFGNTQLECTMVRAAIINEHEPSFSLDNLCQKYIGERKEDPYEELAKMFGGKPDRATQILNLQRAPEELAARYTIKDPILAIKLWLWQEEEIRKQELESVWRIERDVLPVLFNIERHGIRINTGYVEKEIPEIDRKIVGAQKSLNETAGKPINANSAPQVVGLFSPEKKEDDHWYVGSFRLPSTGTGRPSVGADELRALAAAGHPAASNILAMRKLSKAKSFLTNHIQGHLHNGRVHTNFNQLKNDRDLGTITGRLSADDPALQQIPSRDDDMAAIVRSAFLPDAGEEWLCFDWQQFEFRWFAHYVDDPGINGAYGSDPSMDFHKAVAEITGLPRSPRFAGDANAKQINLGMVFGMGEGKLAAEMGLPHTIETRDINGEERDFYIAGDEAKRVFRTYHGSIPGVRALLDRAASIAKSRGYVKTAGGRHIRFPGKKFTHKAGGLIFQGTSADCMKIKMVEIMKQEEKLGFKFLLPVHDEYDLSVPKSEVDKVRELVKEILEGFGENDRIPCRIPIRCSMGVGPNWYEASK